MKIETESERRRRRMDELDREWRLSVAKRVGKLAMFLLLGSGALIGLAYLVTRAVRAAWGAP